MFALFTNRLLTFAHHWKSKTPNSPFTIRAYGELETRKIFAMHAGKRARQASEVLFAKTAESLKKNHLLLRDILRAVRNSS